MIRVIETILLYIDRGLPKYIKNVCYSTTNSRMIKNKSYTFVQYKM